MITITKHTDIRESGFGCWIYLFWIQFPDNSHNYTFKASDEGMMRLISCLEAAGNDVSYSER